MISKEQFHKEIEKVFNESQWKIWKNRLKRRTMIKWIGLGIFITIFILIAILGALKSFYLFLIAPVLVLAYLGVVYIYKRVFKNNSVGIKEDGIQDVLKILLEGYKYKYSNLDSIGEMAYRRNPFRKDFDNVKGEDYLKVYIPNDDGSPSYVSLTISDVSVTKDKIIEDEHGFSHREPVLVYKGAIAEIDFHFDFKCKLNINFNPGTLKRIYFEDIEFNKQVQVFSDNELEAMLIITPSMVNKLKVFQQRAKNFNLSLQSHYLFFEFANKNIFEVNEKGSPIEYFDSIYDDVELIISIVEEIKNNNKIFKI